MQPYSPGSFHGALCQLEEVHLPPKMQPRLEWKGRLVTNSWRLPLALDSSSLPKTDRGYCLKVGSRQGQPFAKAMPASAIKISGVSWKRWCIPDHCAGHWCPTETRAMPKVHATVTPPTCKSPALAVSRLSSLPGVQKGRTFCCPLSTEGASTQQRGGRDCRGCWELSRARTRDRRRARTLTLPWGK